MQQGLLKPVAERWLQPGEGEKRHHGSSHHTGW